MENFVLYEEVGKSENCVVYKGRRKGTIQFVAIHCVDKCQRPEVTNLVRLTHEIDHINIVKFYEWYETSNHLWLVVELCTGGSLETVLVQDERLPESSIRKFGIDMVQGLHHIHSLGIIFSDLKPSKLLLDGPGVLKFADFGLCRVEGEDLAELFQQFIEAGEAWTTEGAGISESQDDGENAAGSETKKYNTTGCPTYIAPEVLDGTGDYTFSSDLWSLGCIFYEMYTGHPPFEADNLEQLVEKVVHEELPLPRVKGSRVTGKPSPEFQDLLTKLLAKNTSERLGWAGLVKHAFWQGDLEHLTKELDVTTADMRESMRDSIANFSTRASSVSDLPKTNSVLGRIHGVHLREVDSGREEGGAEGEEGGVEGEEGGEGGATHPTDRPESRVGLRPKTSPAVGDAQVAFTLSSRPHTAATPDPTNDEHLSAVSPQKLLTQTPVQVKSAIWHAKQQLGGSTEQSEIVQLVYHTSDFTVSSIVDNPKIQKLTQLKYDAKGLSMPSYSVERLLSASQPDLEKHVAALIESIGTPERGPVSQKRVQLLNYVATIGSNSQLANALVAAGMLNTLAVQFKDASLLETRRKLCRVIGIIANNTTELSEDTNIAEVVLILTEVLRDNFRMSKMKIAILPALGEVLYLVASQEEVKGEPKENWAIPQMTYTLTIRCLREGEEAVVNHYAAKIVENVATTFGVHSQKLAVNEVGFLLWYAFTHATADTLRITALSALCRLTKHSITVFQNVIDKVGLPKILSTMALPISRIQQAIITMFASMITADVRLNRLTQDKDFMQQIMRLLESPSVVIRGKAFLVIVEVIRSQQDMLLVCCHNRLVMYVERDSRRQAPGKAENQSQSDYLSRCLEFLISRLVSLVPKISKEILTMLDAVSGRKHPSTIQVKQLKTCLPMMPVLQHLISSQVFRPRIVNDECLVDIGRFVSHVKAIDSGTTQIQAATGTLGSEEFLHTVCALVEIIAKHPAILMEHRELVIDEILPPLAQLVSSSFADTRALSLRLFTEIASVYLNEAQFDTPQQKLSSQPLDEIISQVLLPQFEQILLEQDPLPSYALKLLQAYLDNNPTFIREFEKLGLVPVLFQVLIDHQNNPVSHTMQQIVGVIGSLMSHRETNMQELYEQGLVSHCTSLFMEVMAMNTDDNTDLKSSVSMLQTLLEVLHTILKYVSDVVKKALQAKKTGGDGGTKAAEQAEALLLVNKQFTDLTSFLTPLLIHEDVDIADVSLKCLSLLVQLFGGEHPDAMTKENMECYSEALNQADPKKQKVILRIIKRMLSTEKVHCNMMRKHGGHLAKTIKSLVELASSNAEVALTSLAADILKATGYLPT